MRIKFLNKQSSNDLLQAMEGQKMVFGSVEKTSTGELNISHKSSLLETSIKASSILQDDSLSVTPLQSLKDENVRTNEISDVETHSDFTSPMSSPRPRRPSIVEQEAMQRQNSTNRHSVIQARSRRLSIGEMTLPLPKDSNSFNPASILSSSHISESSFSIAQNSVISSRRSSKSSVSSVSDDDDNSAYTHHRQSSKPRSSHRHSHSKHHKKHRHHHHADSTSIRDSEASDKHSSHRVHGETSGRRRSSIKPIPPTRSTSKAVDDSETHQQITEESEHSSRKHRHHHHHHRHHRHHHHGSKTSSLNSAKKPSTNSGNLFFDAGSLQEIESPIKISLNAVPFDSDSVTVPSLDRHQNSSESISPADFIKSTVAYTKDESDDDEDGSISGSSSENENESKVNEDSADTRKEVKTEVPLPKSKRIKHLPIDVLYLSQHTYKRIMVSVNRDFREALCIKSDREFNATKTEQAAQFGICVEKDIEYRYYREVPGVTNELVAATLPALIEIMTGEGVTDAVLVRDFQATYRYYAKSTDVARLLILKFFGATYREDVTENQRKEWLPISQMKVLNFFKKWIDNCRDDFKDPELEKFLTFFMQYIIETDERKKPFAISILNNIKDEKIGNSAEVGNVYKKPEGIDFAVLSKRRQSAPSNILARSISGFSDAKASLRIKGDKSHISEKGLKSLSGIENMSNHSLLANELNIPLREQVTPEALASQLTLIEQSFFKEIKKEEFYFQGWSGPDKDTESPNLTKLVRWFNMVAYGVASDIVTRGSVKVRAYIIKRWIIVAQLSLRMNNFNAVFEVVAGLNLGPVTRLTKTWESLPKKYLDIWDSLNQVVSNKSSYKMYRSLLVAVRESSGTDPIIPYLGLNIQDLTFAEDGNSTFYTPKNEKIQRVEITKTATSAVGIRDGKVQEYEQILREPENMNKRTSSYVQPLINFDKFRLVSKLIYQTLEYQAGFYEIEPDKLLQQNLNDWETFTDAELYKISRLAEPKETVI